MPWAITYFPAAAGFRGHCAQRNIEAFLATDPRDVGCEEAMEMLDVYAELCVGDPAATEQLYPGIAAHIRAYGPCATVAAHVVGCYRCPCSSDT
jgi:hypothetical protein